MNTDELPDILTMKQACGVLNCHPNTLRNWDTEGKIEAIRFGSRGDRRFRKSDILNFLNSS
ncbi:TPA: DNA-binding protein [Candidatus Uhrbacteria bacterium]|nr:DNA-binding protein [Candidatus Uhrbacteria bacterium]